MRNIKKLLSILVLSALLITFVLAGCGEQNNNAANATNSVATAASSSSDSNSSTSAPKAAENVKLTWSMWGADTDKDAWGKIAKMVTDKYPNIQIDLQISDWNTYWQKLQTQIASGTSADLFGTQAGTKFLSYSLRGAFLPLQKYIDADSNIDIKDFAPGVLDGYKYKNEIGALPYDFGPPILFYNKDIFDKYGVSYPTDKWTWNDFVDASKKLTNPKDKVYGYAAITSPYWIFQYILANGGTYLDPATGEISVNNPKAIEAIQWDADIINVSKASPTVAEQTTLSGWDRWFAGSLAMKLDGPWDIMNSKSRCKFKFGISSLPISPAGKITAPLSGSGFGVFSKTKHPDECYKAISVITGKDALGYLASEGRAFAARTSQQDQFYQKANIDGLKEAMGIQLKDVTNILTPQNSDQAIDFLEQNCIQPIFYGKAKASDIIPKFDAQIRTQSKAEVK